MSSIQTSSIDYKYPKSSIDYKLWMLSEYINAKKPSSF